RDQGRRPRRLRPGARLMRRPEAPRLLVKAQSMSQPARLARVAATAIVVIACAAAQRALAADAPTPDAKVAFTVGANNDYRFRGVSQTDNDPSVFGGADLSLGSIGYAGTWVSNVDFGNGTDFEYDLYAGVKPVVGPVTLDLGVIRYG